MTFPVTDASSATQQLLTGAETTALFAPAATAALQTAGNVLLAAATPAGTNIIGKVGIDQTTGQNVVAVNSPTSIAAGQGTISTTAASLVAARAARKTITIENTSAVAFYVGPTGVTATTGLLVPGVVGASVTVDSAAAFFAITASGSATASFLETF